MNKHNGHSRLRRLRWTVFRIWFLTLAVIISCFGITAVAPQVPVNDSEFLKSASLILGLVLPPLGAIFAFYRRADENMLSGVGVTDEFVEITIACSIIYHFALNALIVLGVAFQKLVPHLEPELLYRNCTFIVNCIGLLSILLGPAAWLFTSDMSRSSETSVTKPDRTHP
jgi:hypothetical protein